MAELYISKAYITKFAKTILASHLEGPSMKHPRTIPWTVVEKHWREADAKERADYRWEATQVLRTVWRA